MAVEMFRWNGKVVELLVTTKSKAILEEACILVEKAAKASIGQVPPPAPPGHPPAAPTGTLKGRITHEPPKVTPQGLVGRVGTNLEYARRVELGFVGTDKLGRKYNQAPRPYLRPALEKSKKIIKQMFGAK